MEVPLQGNSLQFYQTVISVIFISRSRKEGLVCTAGASSQEMLEKWTNQEMLGEMN